MAVSLREHTHRVLTRTWHSLKRLEQPSRGQARTPEVLVLTHREDPRSNLLSAELQQSAHYCGHRLTVLDLATEEPLHELGQYQCIVLTTGVLGSRGQPELAPLVAHIRSGGGLVVLAPPSTAELDEVIGIRGPTADHAASSSQHEAIHFCHDLFPGLKGTTVSTRELASRIVECDLYPPDQFTVLAEAVPSRRPLAWKGRYGEGRVVVWNTEVITHRLCRGLLVQSLLAAQKLGVMPIANAAMIHVDDFPAAFSDLDRKPLQNEFNTTFLPFLENIWLPDILTISEEFGIHLTFFMPFAYNATVSPPFDFLEFHAPSSYRKGSKLPFAVRCCRAIGKQHELALHGYNHIPLTLTNWRSKKTMVRALRRTLKKWEKHNLGPLPRSYAPPMNNIDPAGIRAVSEAVPSIKGICSCFEGDPNLGEAREFGPEPWDSQLFSLPRVTSGYVLTPLQQLMTVCQVAMMGGWTHFIHPDDIIDTPDNDTELEWRRNPKHLAWKTGNACTLLGAYRQWLQFMKNNYPWLRYRTTADGLHAVQNYLTSKPKVSHLPGRIEISAPVGTYLLLRLQESEKTREITAKRLEIVHHDVLEDFEIIVIQMCADTATLSYKL
ncbi:DUF2194 domain-containing protein [Cyanobium sp. NIES-981]|uniref:DUF2194 domain-containing protein n=1 Tax=Cyanobium sp. NIES-981 TaxID=1851505 RepID=UPI0007DE10CC|nr:DUF2194 domain-containing protein [Cyanobium sp. NIES-981]SBO43228.1 conserved protein of unknown function [Cyanobium sp. NIES-981]